MHYVNECPHRNRSPSAHVCVFLKKRKLILWWGDGVNMFCMSEISGRVKVWAPILSRLSHYTNPICRPFRVLRYTSASQITALLINDRCGCSVESKSRLGIVSLYFKLTVLDQNQSPLHKCSVSNLKLLIWHFCHLLCTDCVIIWGNCVNFNRVVFSQIKQQLCLWEHLRLASLLAHPAHIKAVS